MQLDLLQKEAIPATQNAPSFSPKQNKTQHSLLLETNPVSSKPLPDSINPSVLLKQSDTSILADKALEKNPGVKNPDAFKTISEAAKFLGVPQHVLRFWESRFSQIKPMKSGGGRRYYRPEDMEILSTVKHLLYKQGYTIKGAKKAFSLRKQDSSPKADMLHKEIQAFPDVKQRILTDKQYSQLAVIRQELIGLRETLAIRI